MRLRQILDFLRETGAPEKIRTPNLLIRSQVLYPIELRARAMGSAGLAARPRTLAKRAGFGKGGLAAPAARRDWALPCHTHLGESGGDAKPSAPKGAPDAMDFLIVRRCLWLLPLFLAAACTGRCDVLWPALAGEQTPCMAAAAPEVEEDALGTEEPAPPRRTTPTPSVPTAQPDDSPRSSAPAAAPSQPAPATPVARPDEPLLEEENEDPNPPTAHPDWPILTLGTFYDEGVLIDDRLLQVPNTGTPQAARYRELALEVQRLRAVLPTYDARLATVRSDRERASVAYYGELAAVSARIQGGGALGDPGLRDALTRAEAQLDALAGADAQLGQLADEVAADRSIASLLRDQLADAAALRPEDPADPETRERLSEAVEETATLFDRLLEEVDAEVAAAGSRDPEQAPELAVLRQAAADGVLQGLGVGRTGLPAEDPEQSASGSGFDAYFRTEGRLPLMVVHLEDKLDTVRPEIWQAIARHVSPDGSDASRFSVVAVSPALEQASAEALYSHQVLQRAEAVRQSLMTLGVAAERIRIFPVSSASVSEGEIRLYGP